jgi:Tol biopolymer transport system component
MRRGTGLVVAWTVTVAAMTFPASVVAAASPRGGASIGAAVSADGRFVAFASTADDLVAGDTNRSIDVFVRDRGTGRTERVSIGADGEQARRSLLGSDQPTISGDGRFVAFSSAAANLVPGDTNGDVDVFVRDRVAGKTARVSLATGGAQARRGSALPTISADGRVVAFVSAAANLVRGDTNRALDVFARDLTKHVTERVSISSSGAQTREGFFPGLAHRPSVSADGMVVAFASASGDLVSGDRNRADDVFVRDRAKATTTLVSVDAAGAQRRSAASRAPSLSADGRLVAFDSEAAFDAGDANRADDVYVRDRETQATTWVSPGTDRRGSEAPSLSGDGRYVLFASESKLVVHDTDGFSDVYRYDRTTSTTSLASIDSWYGRAGTGAALRPSSSASGLVAAFTSAGGLIPDDVNPAPDVLEQVLDSNRLSVSFLGLVSLLPFDVQAPQPPISATPVAGQIVYRTWGGGTREFGASWTPVPPSGLGADRYRYSTGLPDRLNSGENITFGKLDSPASVVLIRPALPLNPTDTFGIPAFVDSGVTYRSYTGGVIEYIIPSADAHVLNPQREVANPAYGGVPDGCTPAPRGCVGDQGP